MTTPTDLEKRAKRLSPEQSRVLRRLHAEGAMSAYELRTSIATLQALERRAVIRVETTLGAIAFPRSACAMATALGSSVARLLTKGE